MMQTAFPNRKRRGRSTDELEPPALFLLASAPLLAILTFLLPPCPSTETVMDYVRFSRPHYEAIARVCRPLDPDAFPPHKLRRFLVDALAGTHPVLADRIAALPLGGVLLLHRHLWGKGRPAGSCGLTDEEVRAVAERFGPLLLTSRFGQALRRSLAVELAERTPDLAVKLDAMSREEFVSLCERVRVLLRSDD
jgi:hypothetical protein